MTEKKFKISSDQIKQLIGNMGGCYASDKILIDGEPVGYRYREEPDDKWYSGWSFFSGSEDQAYADDPRNFAIYEVNTVANYDQAIIPYLNSEFDWAYQRIASTSQFREVPFDQEKEQPNRVPRGLNPRSEITE